MAGLSRSEGDGAAPAPLMIQVQTSLAGAPACMKTHVYNTCTKRGRLSKIQTLKQASPMSPCSICWREWTTLDGEAMMILNMLSGGALIIHGIPRSLHKPPSARSALHAASNLAGALESSRGRQCAMCHCSISPQLLANESKEVAIMTSHKYHNKSTSSIAKHRFTPVRCHHCIQRRPSESPP
jgi:hypothetical protein